MTFRVLDSAMALSFFRHNTLSKPLFRKVGFLCMIHVAGDCFTYVRNDITVDSGCRMQGKED